MGAKAQQCEECGEAATAFIVDVCRRVDRKRGYYIYEPGDKHQFCAKHARDSITFTAGE